MKPIQIAPHVHQLSLGFVNAYAITTPENDWVLVDTGLKFSFGALKDLDSHFGRPPLAIFLTHGHQDHAGSARALAEAWGVKVYASKLERPFLTGQGIYPPPDPTVGGALAQMARVAPWPMINLTGFIETYPAEGAPPFLADWQIISTPGHSPGHISLWHETDRVLIAGDAFCTIDCDSYLGLATQEQVLARAGSPFTPDWVQSKHSVGVLADLEPVVVGAGHGQPISSGELPAMMRDFEHAYKAPEHGRYVSEPAQFNEKGVTYLPPKPEDNFGRNIAAVAGAASVLALVAKISTRRK
jgi:glyoxylase-like metal-dependent hydrolase (beta-lactamase superfamily II)